LLGVAWRELQLAPTYQVSTSTILYKQLRAQNSFRNRSDHRELGCAGQLPGTCRSITGKSGFEALLRYCVWFGFLTALLTGILGWAIIKPGNHEPELIWPGRLSTLGVRRWPEIRD
jgi:hypothetical protein